MRKKPKLDWDSRLWWVTEIDIASFPMRRFFFSLTELGIAGLSWFFTRLAICHKFYKSWLAVIGVALAAKSSCNINDQELLTSGNKPKFSTVKGRVTYLACLFHVHPNFPKKGVWYFWQLWMRWICFGCFERVYSFDNIDWDMSNRRSHRNHIYFCGTIFQWFLTHFFKNHIIMVTKM